MMTNKEYNHNDTKVSPRDLPSYEFALSTYGGQVKPGVVRVVGFLITVAVVGIVAFVLKRYHQNLERAAGTDTLTGTFNRAAFSVVFQQVVKESKRRNEALSLVLVDIDNFKKRQVRALRRRPGIEVVCLGSYLRPCRG
ncbi:MAG TPA: GGDEF domain-containing protein [Desulfobacteraceae bacterium]|nr:GGDEF domain-containing protein [Desulfobacteraceae bacterium]